MTAAYDVIVVGGGPAGSVLATRLSEEPARSVLLLEAGPDYGPDPGAWPAELGDASFMWPDSHPWGYTSPRPAGDEPVALPRARVLGGSATINGCVWLRGSRADYDAWASRGNPGWGFDDLLPAFRMAESDPLAATCSELHGADGPVPVYRFGEEELTPVELAFVAAAQALGFDHLADLNGSEDQRPGVGPAPKNIQDGRRMHAALTYLASARNRPNLRVVPDTHVDRVVFDGRSAIGALASDGRLFSGREIVLSAGAYASPAILLRSGIGPPDHLAELGIPVVQTLPGVGQHLMDHPLLPGLLNRFRIAPDAEPDQRTFVRQIILARSRQVQAEIDLHIYAVQSFDAEVGAWFFSLTPCLMYSRSRGTVRLVSTDPHAPPAIDHNYFSQPEDLEALCDGVELVAKLGTTSPLADLLIPTSGPRSRTRDEMRELVCTSNGTTFHPSSTCLMGPADDPMAVVDQRGRVRGVEHLRVVDASIFPHGPRCNLHFPVVAVAERMAQLFDP